MAPAIDYRHRGGTARHDPFGNRIPGEFNERNQPIGNPQLNNLPMSGNSASPDAKWASMFPNSPTAQRLAAPANPAPIAPGPMAAAAGPVNPQMQRDTAPAPAFVPQASPGFAQMAPGQGRVIADPVAEAHDTARVGGQLAAAAGTGQTVQTPYGPVSSRTTTWQEELAKSHPYLHDANSAGNADFVAAVKAAGINPNDQSPETRKRVALIASNLAQKHAPDPTAIGGPLQKDAFTGQGIAAPPAMGQPVAPVTFAGADAGAAPWSNSGPKPPEVGVAEALGNRYEDVQNTNRNPISPRAIANKAYSLANGAVNSVVDGTRALIGASPIERKPETPLLPNAPRQAPSTVGNQPLPEVPASNYAWSTPTPAPKADEPFAKKPFGLGF